MTDNLELIKFTVYADEVYKKALGKPYHVMVKDIQTTDNKINFVIDCTENNEDLSSEIAALKNIIYNYNGDIHQPNFVKIERGENMFKGCLISFEVNYTIFKPDGSPLKAKIALALGG